jgi:pimeloyl-ACP methyl ester carboxylesterase
MATENSTAWQPFRASQKEVILQAGVAAHIPVRIRYIDDGEARHGVLLLMHGIPTWGYLYHSVIPRLVRAGYRVIAPDFLGHGWSDRRDQFDRSFQDQTRMILGLLSALGLDRVDVVGHDTGGAVALILAIEHSATVRRPFFQLASSENSGVRAQAVERISRSVDPLGEETDELSRLPAPCLQHHHLAKRRLAGPGSL